MQLASIGSGLTFGELAIVGGQPRSAQIVADSEFVCYAISIAALQAFGRSHPAIYVKVLMNIIRDLADTVQFANETIGRWSADRIRQNRARAVERMVPVAVSPSKVLRFENLTARARKLPLCARLGSASLPSCHTKQKY